mgnify:CR=1 FL=1
MLGKTHMMIGIAATLTVTQPKSITELLLATGAGTVGALISDIDVGTSHSHKDADKVTLITAAIVGAVLLLDHFFDTGIVQKIMSDSSILRIISGCLIFVLACAFGKEQPHRSFMHSFLALFILDFALVMILPALVPYFTVGFLSHVAIDLFNMKKVRLFYPMKDGICLGLCRAKGVVNTACFTVGCVVSAVEAALVLLRME